MLNRYIPDIYLYTDVYKGEDSGKYVCVNHSSLYVLTGHQVAWVRLDSAIAFQHLGHPRSRNSIRTRTTSKSVCRFVITNQRRILCTNATSVPDPGRIGSACREASLGFRRQGWMRG